MRRCSDVQQPEMKKHNIKFNPTMKKHKIPVITSEDNVNLGEVNFNYQYLFHSQIKAFSIWPKKSLKVGC